MARLRPTIAAVLVFGTILTLLLIFVVRRSETQHLEQPGNASAIPPNNIASESNAFFDEPVPASKLAQTRQPVPIGRPGDSKNEQMREVLSTYNDQAILFYGKLEDQFSEPVTNAAVDFTVRVINGYKSTTDRGTVRSDGNGLFRIDGYSGQDITVVPHKAGYAIASENRLANYSRLTSEDERAHPDPNNPVVIKMWKLQGAEPLLGIDQKYHLHYADTPLYFDLVAGKNVSYGGDVRIIVKRSPGVLSGRTPMDWSVRLEAVDGGIMDSGGQERVTYAAPIDGYQSGLSFVFSTNAPYKWFGAFDHGFFLISRKNQEYCKLGFSFEINEEPDGLMFIAFSGVANTNGSPNWEADPNTLKPQ